MGLRFGSASRDWFARTRGFRAGRFRCFPGSIQREGVARQGERRYSEPCVYRQDTGDRGVVSGSHNEPFRVGYVRSIEIIERFIPIYEKFRKTDSDGGIGGAGGSGSDARSRPGCSTAHREPRACGECPHPPAFRRFLRPSAAIRAFMLSRTAPSLSRMLPRRPGK